MAECNAKSPCTLIIWLHPPASARDKALKHLVSVRGYAQCPVDSGTMRAAGTSCTAPAFAWQIQTWLEVDSMQPQAGPTIGQHFFLFSAVNDRESMAFAVGMSSRDMMMWTGGRLTPDLEIFVDWLLYGLSS